MNALLHRAHTCYSNQWEEWHKLSIYKECKLEFCVEKYLDLHIIVQLLTKLRSDTLKLNVETGKYQNVARENRICLSYNMNALEDKYHFVLVCPDVKIKVFVNTKF
jgi:hypothetical protein